MAESEYVRRRNRTTPFRWQVLVLPLCALGLVAIELWNLSGSSIAWDEGWTLSVARTWVERGHYGRLLNGQLFPPGMEAAFPVTGSVALSFRLFGVGLWQGRLPIVIFTLATLAVIYDLAGRLYNREVARGTLAVLLLMSPLHPLLLGRLVFAEMPMLFSLLVGYTCFLIAVQSRPWFLAAAIGFWGIGLITKAQVLPFWAVSLAIPLAVAVYKREWRLAGAFVSALLGSYVVSKVLIMLLGAMLRGHTLPAVPIQGLYAVTALVLVVRVHVAAFGLALLLGLPMLLGLGYGVWDYIRRWGQINGAGDGVVAVRLALLLLAGSWFAWYVLLSSGWSRYMFPATFIGSMFAAVLLDALTTHYQWRMTVRRGALALTRLPLDRHRLGSLLAILLIAILVPVSGLSFFHGYTETDRSAFDVAAFLNTQTSPDALIETYNTELHFLLDRRYHYPPDQVHVLLDHPDYLTHPSPVDYDPLSTNPDYLVVGKYPQAAELYNPALASGTFRLVRRFGPYDVYERAR